MLGQHVRSDHADGGREHRGVIGVADQRQIIRNHVKRQNKISERAPKGRAHGERSLTIERAVIGGKRILRERNACGDRLHLLPDARLDVGFVGR